MSLTDPEQHTPDQTPRKDKPWSPYSSFGVPDAPTRKGRPDPDTPESRRKNHSGVPVRK
ncbi:hypothetical protein IHN63_00320 [Deinococcus sp. 6YEL10]|uniref:hypothetical protein n=1 Tax=Deinococcus sp. 6YEL10 TaxID=2745870 RepID=UPI001E40355F|nr:hypothetical protein [Deinococcus sp. 6YEL10]MCD0159743.1 hypothetical protein [Deinococcus sp. 6YEL10]